MVQIYGIKNCDSVKKAIKFFKEHNVAFMLHDFKTEPVSCQKIETWLKSTDMKILFNARSTTYRTLKLKEKNLSVTAQTEWLCKENLLIKRPVVEFDNQLIVGFKEDIYKGTFL